MRYNPRNLLKQGGGDCGQDSGTNELDKYHCMGEKCMSRTSLGSKLIKRMYYKLVAESLIKRPDGWKRGNLVGSRKIIGSIRDLGKEEELDNWVEKRAARIKEERRGVEQSHHYFIKDYASARDCSNL